MPARHPLSAGALGLASVLLARACSPAAPPEAPVTREAFDAGLEASDPPLDAAAEAQAEVEAEALADAAPEADAPLDAGAPEAPVALVIEKPYVLWARPRPKGLIAAGSHDELVGRWNLGGSSSPDHPANRAGHHPGTRVKVDTRVTSGRLPKSAPVDRKTGKPQVVLSETSLRARSRKLGYWPFRVCYERWVAEHGKLAGGETVLSFAVDRAGRIGVAKVLRSKLTEAEVTACLASAVREIELLPPPRRIQVELAVQLWPGDVPVPKLAPIPTAPELTLPLDAGGLESALEKARPSFETCYRQGLARDPALWGRLQLHVEHDAQGAVTSAQQSESHFPDPGVTRCVLGHVREMTFARRAGRLRAFEIALRFGREPASSAAESP